MKVSVDKLSFSYRDRSIFEQLSFACDGSGVVAILGVSGSGKSTLVRLLSGLETKFSGAVNYDNSQQPSMYVVFQDSALLPWKTVRKNIELAAGGSVNKIADIARLVGLANSLELYPHELSGGMKQRVEFAKVLLLKPDILFLDEPFSRLDIQFKALLHDLFLSIRETHAPTTFLVTHDIEEAVKIASHVLVLRGNPVNRVDSYDLETLDKMRAIEVIKDSLSKDFLTYQGEGNL